MVAFDRRVEGADGRAFAGPELWFAARTRSKPGYAAECESGGPPPPDCWTLVSTPGFAVAEITETPMQSATGEFRPQENSYLNSGPGPKLLAAFRRATPGA